MNASFQSKEESNEPMEDASYIILVGARDLRPPYFCIICINGGDFL